MVQISDVADKLLTLDAVREKLSSTEPLTSSMLTSDDKVLFTYDPEWALTLDQKQGTDLVDAAIRINGQDHQMTKDAALSISSAFGLQSTYVKKVPAHLLEPQMNYWLSAGLGDRAFKVLNVGNDQNVAAFTKPTINPFSNQLLLNSIVNGIEDRYGEGTLYADYKFQHSLVQTDIRLIVPEFTRTIVDTAVEGDLWSAGVHLSNSLTGENPLTVEGYLFRYWCTNGATTLNSDIGKWSRRINGQSEDVYDWVRASVDEIFEGMGNQFDAVQSLTQLNITGNVVEILTQIFDDYKVPVSQRQEIIDNLLDSENMTMYEVMQAITAAANGADVRATHADRLMRIGGAIPSEHFDPLKAKIWREGHLADPTQANPYELQVITVPELV